MMITIEQVKYKPFFSAQQGVALTERELAERQSELGLGDVSNLVARDNGLEVEYYERKLRADKLGAIFDHVEIKTCRGRDFRPYDNFLILNGLAIPNFTEFRHGGNYSDPGMDNQVACGSHCINECQAQSYGVKQVDWSITPPGWASVSFEVSPTKCNKIAFPRQQSHVDLRSPQERPVWVSALPQFPSTVLELASRVRKISPDAKFTLLFMPDWQAEVHIPKLDPILLVWQPTAYKSNEGVWFKIAEWGGDALESVSS